ncbi:putative inactive leucine-rich repeat receptor-like protein kinase [Acorus calamus]|uniref:Inactive leucine-rich repeat receptor-like protein kinase n=1 Tax=Acorus calamus TaxID=4465 RepID=A0AAV9ERZ1_ACOCL|nr:putative inactive leucine-rich repeat receptor-like protein kinase [Acorus calamus]
MLSLRLLIVCLCWFNSLSRTQQLQSTETQLLRQLRKHLEFPKVLEAWNITYDLCFTPSSPSLSISCEGNTITELRITGDKLAKVSSFEGFPIPDQTLSQDFSVDSFITTLTRLTNLKVVILVSLGIWGPLPDKIHRLYSLQVLDLSSNFFYGSIPPKIAAMTMLSTLNLDGNYFNDTVPDWFDTLSNLTIVSMKSNRLKGTLPPSIGRVKSLTELALSSNSISGSLPDLSELTSLETLDLRENNLDSGLPVMPKVIANILLNKNSLSGEIPNQFGELYALQHVDLSFNFFHGTPPAAIFALPNVSYLNLASNMLSGSLPSGLNCGSQLGYVDFSTNRLTGELPTCLHTNSDKIIVKFGGDCLSIDPQHQHSGNYCKNAETDEKVTKSRGAGVMVAVIVGASVVVVLFLLVFFILCRSNCKRASAEPRLLTKSVANNTSTGFSSELLANARYISQAMKLGPQVNPVHRMFTLEELKEATCNFDQTAYMGEGSIGKLYKGKLENGTYVAIRCLALYKRYSVRNLKLRLDMLWKLRHPHLVCLLGHCIEGAQDGSGVDRVFLIYEYMPNGNLRTHLSENSSEKILKWSERLTVLIGVAKAVHFLHTGIIPGLSNNRLKTSNVLLDEHCMAKLSDYGLSIIMEEVDKHEARIDDHKSNPWETREVEDDVYTFGLIIHETLIGSRISEKDTVLLDQMASTFTSQDGRRRVVDPMVLGTSSQESLSTVISIASKCVSTDHSMRPSIEDILWNLQYAAQVQASSDGDQRSDIAWQT